MTRVRSTPLHDAAFHLRNAERALERAVDEASGATALRRYQQLAAAARKLLRVTRHEAQAPR
jgi:hypothetical protein